MIRIEAGPVGMLSFIVLVIVIAVASALAFIWWRQRAFRSLHQKIVQIKQIEPILDEVRRLLDLDKKGVDTFVSNFAQEVAEHFTGEPWTRQITLADIRSHVEAAVFEMVRGCSCGGCPGVSNGGPFWIEAWRTDQGLHLNGMLALCVTRMGEPDRQDMRVVAPGANVTMVCVKCQGPVVTSIDHLSEGKQPLCAVCVGKEPARG